jgi:hypothetical protein
MEQELTKMLSVVYVQEKKKRRQESAHRKITKSRNRIGEEVEVEK